MFVFVKGDNYVPHGDVCVLDEGWLCSLGCPHENVFVGCVPWGNAYVPPRNGKEMVVLPSRIALLQVLIMNEGFFLILKIILHIYLLPKKLSPTLLPSLDNLTGKCVKLHIENISRTTFFIRWLIKEHLTRNSSKKAICGRRCFVRRKIKLKIFCLKRSFLTIVPQKNLIFFFKKQE